MNKHQSVTILAPCLNEIDGLPKILPKIKKEWYDQLIVLDGWSTDGSREWCKDNGYTVFLRSAPNVGLWQAYTEVFKSGIIKGDIIITFSPDGNSIPEAIPELINKMNTGYDMVIASRYLGDASSEDDTFLTKIGNRILTWVANVVSGFHYTDALVMYRAYQANIISKLSFLDEPNWLQKQLIKTSGLYSYEPSLAIRAGRAKLRLAEIPASEPKAYRERRQVTFIHGFVLLTQILHEGLCKKKG